MSGHCHSLSPLPLIPAVRYSAVQQKVHKYCQSRRSPLHMESKLTHRE